MRALDQCPACAGAALDDLSLPVDLTPQRLSGLDVPVAPDARYSLCRRCELIFARVRQSDEDLAAYHAAFPELEGRVQTAWPLPARFVAAQRDFAAYLADALDAAGLLRRGARVLNVRCENGEHLERLRTRHGATTLVGLDYFESNLRACRERGIPHVQLLDPAARLDKIEIGAAPAEGFDLVLANHQLTHALEPLAVLQALRARIAPGGVLVLYNEIDHLPVFARCKRHRRGFNDYHKQLLTRTSLANLCAYAGLDAREVCREARGRSLAASGHSMVWAARRTQPLEASAAPPCPADPGAVHRAIALGRLSLRALGWVDRLRGRA